jgi:hypothetical protein
MPEGARDKAREQNTSRYGRAPNAVGSIHLSQLPRPSFRQSLAEKQNTAYTELMNLADRHIALFRKGGQARELNTLIK